MSAAGDDDDALGRMSVYAHFGMAAHAAQMFEDSAILVVVLLQAMHPARPLKGKTFGEAFDVLDKQTLGRLIANVDGLAEIDAEFITKLKTLSVDRNYLCHSFFKKHQENLATTDGKKEMIGELKLLSVAFQEGNRFLTQMYVFLGEQIGFDMPDYERLAQQYREQGWNIFK